MACLWEMREKGNGVGRVGVRTGKGAEKLMRARLSKLPSANCNLVSHRCVVLVSGHLALRRGRPATVRKQPKCLQTLRNNVGIVQCVSKLSHTQKLFQSNHLRNDYISVTLHRLALHLILNLLQKHYRNRS